MWEKVGTGSCGLETRRQGSLIYVMVVLLAANVAVITRPSRLVVFCAGLVLTCLLPGALLTRIALSGWKASDWVVEAILTVGFGFSTLILGTLGLHYLPGPLVPTHILILYDSLVFLLAAADYLRRRPRIHCFRLQWDFWHLLPLGLVLVAAFFRFANLGCSEFQGDESRAMLMAAGVIRGEDEILFLHRKGPAEVLIPTAFYALHGTTTELLARLPFALTSVTGVLTIYAITRRLFPRHAAAAPMAAGLLAVDGYLVAFGRLVQYQSVVFLMTVLAAWCAYVWYRDGRTILLVVAALFLAVGTLAHYEAVLVTPFLAWLFWSRGRREGWSALQCIQRGLSPAVVFVVACGVFYVPFVRHPHFLADTAEYIAAERIGGDLLYNNLETTFFRATFYNSTYYIVFLGLAVLVLVINRLWRALHSKALALAIETAFVAGLAGVFFLPEVFVVRGLNLAILPFAIVLAVLILSPHIKNELKATLLWFGVPFLVALFLMARPKTHVYTMFPAWVMLVGLTFSQVSGGIGRRWNRGSDHGSEQSSWTSRVLRWGSTVVAVALLTVFGYYIYIVFVRHTPDFRRDGYPATRPPFYVTFYGDWDPGGGGFAFPHRGGWKAVGALYAQGVLQGSYRSNEESITTSWYTRQAPWCGKSPDYYFITSVTHDRWDIHPNRVRRENDLLGKVWSDGQMILEIYSSNPVDTAVDYDLAELEPVFDAATQPDVWLWGLKDPVPLYPVDATLGQRVSLMGFDASRQVVPGEVLSTVLYWQPLTASDRYYNVFVHVEVEGKQIWGQSDEAPACGSESTKEWQPGEIVVDGHTLRIAPATPPGEYPLLAGLYDPMTGERVPVTGQDANDWGNAVRLGTVQVVAPPQPEVAQEDVQ